MLVGFPIGFDLDGTIDENPSFFSLLDSIWPNKTYIITYRMDLAGAISDARKFGVNKAEVLLAASMDDKARIIDKTGIKVYFDDTDEVITHIPMDVTVLKMWNSGNFEFGKWLYSNYTGTNIDD